VNEHNHARLGFLVDEEHARSEVVDRGLDARLGVKVLWLTPYEVLVGGDKLAGVNLSRALGCTTTLIVAQGPRAPRTQC
jgi:hypothetical protein